MALKTSFIFCIFVVKLFCKNLSFCSTVGATLLVGQGHCLLFFLVTAFTLGYSLNGGGGGATG